MGTQRHETEKTLKLASVLTCTLGTVSSGQSTSTKGGSSARIALISLLKPLTQTWESRGWEGKAKLLLKGGWNTNVNPWQLLYRGERLYHYFYVLFSCIKKKGNHMRRASFTYQGFAQQWAPMEHQLGFGHFVSALGVRRRIRCEALQASVRRELANCLLFPRPLGLLGFPRYFSSK